MAIIVHDVVAFKISSNEHGDLFERNRRAIVGDDVMVGCKK